MANFLCAEWVGKQRTGRAGSDPNLGAVTVRSVHSIQTVPKTASLPTDARDWLPKQVRYRTAPRPEVVVLQQLIRSAKLTYLTDCARI